VPTAYVDLHCHSTASDGEHPPEEVAQRAAAAGLAAIALTDHDTTDGTAAAQRAGETLGVQVISGCEFSVKAPWGELHLLGYFLPVGDARVEAFLEAARAARRRRGAEMVTRLQRMGVALDLEAVEREVSDGALGRPHVARALVAAGFTADINEAFGRWLARGRPAFVEKPLPSLRQVSDLLHAVGGLAVAAHLGDRGTENQIRALREDGLDGIEVRHPSHVAGMERRLTAIAERLDLAVTGGSDWHGEMVLGRSHAPLGGMEVPAEWLAALEQRRAAAAPAVREER
jgi:predicted metal-dependent phosphoesterase TrpH